MDKMFRDFHYDPLLANKRMFEGHQYDPILEERIKQIKIKEGYEGSFCYFSSFTNIEDNQLIDCLIHNKEYKNNNENTDLLYYMVTKNKYEYNNRNNPDNLSIIYTDFKYLKTY
jgi:hypothetical protein